MNLTKSKPQPKFGRKLRKLESAPSTHQFEIYSLTREGHQHEHLVEITADGRAVHCSCEDFQHRHARHWPGVADISRHCKHVTRALAYLSRTKALPVADERACVSCGAPGAALELADDNGHAIPGNICPDCVTRNRMMDDTPEPASEEVFVTIWRDDFEAMQAELAELRAIAAQLEYSANAKNGLY